MASRNGDGVARSSYPATPSRMGYRVARVGVCRILVHLDPVRDGVAVPARDFVARMRMGFANHA